MRRAHVPSPGRRWGRGLPEMARENVGGGSGRFEAPEKALRVEMDPRR